MSYNCWTGVGRFGKDPEMKYTSGGTAVVNFSIATDETWKDKQGEKQQKTEWHRCVAWSKLAEIIGNYCKKGQLVLVTGRLETRKWTDRDNVTRYSTEIVVNTLKMLGGKPNGSGAPAGPERTDEDFERPGGERVSQPAEKQANAAPAQDFTDEDIPF